MLASPLNVQIGLYNFIKTAPKGEDEDEDASYPAWPAWLSGRQEAATTRVHAYIFLLYICTELHPIIYLFNVEES